MKSDNTPVPLSPFDTIQQISKVSYGNGSKVESFAYDNVGNRLERTIETGSVLTKERYAYDNKNRLQVLEKDNTKVTYLYDNQGNTLEEQHQDLTSKTTSTTTYVYDGFNRNTKVTTKDGNTQENLYDPMGLRTSVVRNGVTSNYIFRGTEVSHELDEDNNVKNREVRGYKLLSKDTENTTKENSINLVSDSYSSSKLYFYLHNEHSDITNLVDEENIIKNKYEYDVFGDVTVSDENVDNEFKYYEQQLDTTTHLYYLRARYYDPRVGRFTQEDVYRGDGLNLYAYVKNNPVMWLDPTGYLAHQKTKNITNDSDDVLELSTRFLNQNDQLWKNADNISPIEGYQDIVVHGDKYSFVYKNADGKETNVSVKDFADMLKESPVYNGGPIRLISCETGAEDAIVAKEFATMMGVDVMAPSDTVFVYPDGEMKIGINNDGYWSIFKPKGGN